MSSFNGSQAAFRSDDCSAINHDDHALFADNAAWHRKGKVVETGGKGFDSSVILESPLNFVENKKPLFYEDGVDSEGRQRFSKYEEIVAAYREDTGKVLGHVSPSYESWQNADFIKYADSFCQDSILRYESAFSMYGGRKIVLCSRLPHIATPCEGDKVLTYLNFVNGHGGNYAALMFASTFRTVCKNTERLAFSKAKNFVLIKHTKNMLTRLEDAKLFMSQLSSSFTLYNENAAKLASTYYSNVNLHDFIQTLFPKKEKATERVENNRLKEISTFMDCLRTENALLPSVMGTKWAMYNALTRYVDHCTKYNGDDTVLNDQKRFDNITLGGGADFKSQAFELALSL